MRAAWARIVGGREVVEARDDLGAERLARLLQVLHLRANPLEPLYRVLDEHGERRAHRRDAVAERPCLVRRPDRDRHLRSHLHALGLDPAGVKPVAHAAGDDGEDDVVDRAAEDVLDALELRQVGAHPDEAPVRADRHVQRKRRGRGSRSSTPTSPTRARQLAGALTGSRGWTTARSARRASASGIFARPPKPFAASCADEGSGDGTQS